MKTWRGVGRALEEKPRCEKAKVRLQPQGSVLVLLVGKEKVGNPNHPLFQKTGVFYKKREKCGKKHQGKKKRIKSRCWRKRRRVAVDKREQW